MEVRKFDNDPLFSFVVPVYDTPLEIFKRCLMSIAEQDYPNIEVVIVPNGGEKLCTELALEFIDSLPIDKAQMWTVKPLAEKGACQARNHGFKNCTGEIVSFFNSDYIAKLGVVRMWVDQLQAHPECGFAYGKYEYASSQRDVYESKEFDPFQLTVANYIDCGFPIWRKHVAAWDPQVKSLQDWDFWLSVVRGPDKSLPLSEAMVRGHFLGREISFVARYPAPKGLSNDSSDNWMERVRFIKKKHGIPERDVCVASIGAPNHGVEIAKMLGADYRDDTLHKPHEYKALYLIGWYMKPGEPNGHSRILAQFQKSKRIVHFVGADIFWLRKFSVEKIKQWAGAMKLNCTSFLCENEAAQKELKDYFIDAQIVPIPPYSSFEVKPLPEEFSVALYLTNKSDFDKYLLAHTLSIVHAMPDVKFYGYGDADVAEFKAKNFEHKGFLKRPDWEQFVYKCSAYLRLVRHDTRPMASDEFIMAGRDVITNIPGEFVELIDTSGNLAFDEWDKFDPGFSAIRWPDTKKRIVQKIREVRDANVAWETRVERSLWMKSHLDKKIFRNRIRMLVEEKVPLEVITD